MKKLTEELINGFKEAKKRGASDVALCALGSGVFGWKIEESIQSILEATKEVKGLNYIWVCGCQENFEKNKEVYEKIKNNFENIKIKKNKF